MAIKKNEQYGNSSISMLKGEDRVRKRPAVIFGSDDLEGCKHAVFEILSNAIDEAREGHGDLIIVTRYEDLSVEVEDFGRGCPVDYNEKEKRYNWELVFCEMYAGGKYGENGEDVEFEYLDTIKYEGKEYIVLMPLDEESNEIVILEVQPVDEELENYVTVSDEAILDAVYAIFKDHFKDILDFAD